MELRFSVNGVQREGGLAGGRGKPDVWDPPGGDKSERDPSVSEKRR